MSYFTHDVWGGAVDEPDAATVRRLLDGLADADDEHPDVALSHESGWCLGAFRGGLLVRENVEEGATAPRELRGLGREETLRLFGLLARGDIATVEALPWQR